MNIDDLSELRETYLSRKDVYEKCRELMHKKLELIVQNLGIQYFVRSRVKDVESFIKKSIRKRSLNPLVEITDQIGIRIITTYQHDIDEIDNLIIREFNNHNRENKLHSLRPNELGYLGIHFEVPVYESLQELGKLENDLYNGVTCEIQLHTQAQNLWADISHQLSYKPKTANDPNIKVQRSIYRLISLIEIFDSEVNIAKTAILNQSDFPEAKLLDCLEKYFYEFSTKSFDREFSIENLAVLKSLLEIEEIKDFRRLMGDFVEINRQKIKIIFDKYSQDNRDLYKLLMLFQPESILIFWLLKKDKFRLLDKWQDFLPYELLEFMATIWGEQLPSS
jgi:putative GTP pyrophosphokinase